MTDPAHPGNWPRTDQEWLALLRWLYGSAPLLTPPPGCELLDPLLVPHLPDRNMLQQARERLACSTDLRLGKLFEALVNLAITAQPHLEIVARNLVIDDARQTLGELDLIIRDQRDGAVIHVEVTLKFYLGLPDGNFPGPNPADSLARKHARLAAHQFPLLRRPQTRAKLAALGVPAVNRQCLFSRGRLFYPQADTVQSPVQAWADHERGIWWHASATPAKAHWRLLARPQWMAPETMSDSDAPLLASDALIDYVQAGQRPQMVVRQDNPGDLRPAFVVPDQGWPN